MRFQPDTLVDALLRPIAMAAPDANVYVEIMAPDFRFLFLLTLIGLLAAWRVIRSVSGRQAVIDIQASDKRSSRPVVILLAALAAALVPWLATSGNGRYFIAGLLITGPVCVGLTRLLPVTRALRLALVAGMLAVQGFAVSQTAPWHAWTLASWKDAPYFHVDVPTDLRAHPATYVTLSAISYSLLAPMFHPQSRWASLHNAPALDNKAADWRRTEAFLSKSEPGRLKLLVPAVAGMLTVDRLPNGKVSQALEGQLAPFRLRLAAPQSCRFLSSRGLASMGLGMKSPEERAQSGFWLCELTRSDVASPSAHRSNRHDRVFKMLEAQCPRFFPMDGDSGSVELPNGQVRNYLRGEMKAYVYDSGEVFYKYYRALNPVLVGNAEDLRAGKSRLDCGNIRGRAGLPWQREI